MYFSGINVLDDYFLFLARKLFLFDGFWVEERSGMFRDHFAITLLFDRNYNSNILRISIILLESESQSVDPFNFLCVWQVILVGYSFLDL